MKIIRFVSAFTILVLAFQNCGKTNPQDGQALMNPPSSSKAIGQTNEFYKIRNFSASDISGTGVKDVAVDLSNGQISYQYFDERTANCELSDDRLNQLGELLANARICEAVREIGVPYCMAIGISDFVMTHDRGEVELRPIICGSGRDLCGDDAAKLREIFSSLKSSPPAQCQ